MTHFLPLRTLENDFSRAAENPLTRLARNLVEGAEQFDLKKAQNLGVNFRYTESALVDTRTGQKIEDVTDDIRLFVKRINVKIERNPLNPPSYTTQEAATASWAARLDDPLEEGEVWNKGRRATASGIIYMATNNAVINPYMNTGIKGRGCLGQPGPNHAVDNGILMLKPNQNGDIKLYALGILRKFDGNTPALSGGFAKFRKELGGEYILDEEVILQSKLEEFFEEMVSGSIELLPEYSNRLPMEVALEVQNEAFNVKNPRGRQELLSKERIELLIEEIKAHLKFEQVSDLDSGFVQRLRDKIANGKECYAGPVLNDDRNTNNAWLETRLSWILMDEFSWKEIRGPNPVFDYQLSAGDDASGVVWHEISPTLMETAFASHAALFAFMTASFLLDCQEKDVAIPPSVIQQVEEVEAFFQAQKPPAPLTAPQLKLTA